MSEKSRIPVWFYIFLAAYAVRMFYVMEISDRPYFTAPAVDAEFHDYWAMRIAEGHLFYEDGPFFRAPLYAYFLGATYAVFGHDYFVVRIIQALIGALSCVLAYQLGKKLFNHRAGLIAGWAMAFTGIIVYYEAELLIPVILLPLCLLSMLWLLKALKSGRKRDWLMTGIFLGLAAIARPNALAALPIVFVVILWKQPLKKALIIGSIFLLGLAIPISPVTWHNIHQGEFILIAHQGGVNFYIGNNPEADGAGAVFPGLGNIWRYEDTIVLAEIESGKKLSANEVSNFYYRKGLHFIFSQPGKWLKLLSTKFLHLINNVEVSNNKNIYFAAKDSVLLTILLNNGFWLYGSLGAVGIVLFYRRRSEYRIIAWFIILYAGSFLLFFITARFRLTVVPFLIVLAAGAVDWALQRIKAKDYKVLGTPALAAVIVMGLTGANLTGIMKIAPAYSHFSLGNAYMKNGRSDMAELEFHKALEADPQYLQVNLNLGVIYYDRGDYTQAQEYFLKELEVNHGFEAAYALNNLGNIRVKQGMIEESIHFYEKALQIYPNYKDGKINLARSCHDVGALKISQDSLQIALGYMQRAAELQPQNVMFIYNYGLAMGEAGREQEALEQMRKALEINPDFSPAKEVLNAYERMQAEK